MSDTYGDLEQQLDQLLKDYEELKERHARLVEAAKAVNELTSQPVELPASEWWDAMNMALHALRAELEQS